MRGTVRTPECFPPQPFLGLFKREPHHENCPGGSIIPPMLGGWSCPCWCHQGKSGLVEW